MAGEHPTQQLSTELTSTEQKSCCHVQRETTGITKRPHSLNLEDGYRLIKGWRHLFSPKPPTVKTRPHRLAVQFLAEPTQLVETAPYPVVSLGTQLNWTAHGSQEGRTAAQKLGGLVLHIRNGVLFYNELICPMTDYA